MRRATVTILLLTLAGCGGKASKDYTEGTLVPCPSGGDAEIQVCNTATGGTGNAILQSWGLPAGVIGTGNLNDGFEDVAQGQCAVIPAHPQAFDMPVMPLGATTQLCFFHVELVACKVRTYSCSKSEAP